MSDYEECMLAILASPEDDEPRHRLATLVKSSDPALCELIEFQLHYSRRKRAQLARIATSDRDVELIMRQETEWCTNLRFYQGETAAERNVEFHRGLPWLCAMNPYMFLEKGEYITSRIAPLRGIEFFADPDGDPFPARELADHPLLARFDEIRFQPGTLREGDLEIFASSKYLPRLLMMDFRRNDVSLADFEALAANPDTRKSLSIDNLFEVPSDRGRLGEFSARFDVYPTRFFDISREARELEAKYGYLPWLHWTVCDGPDAHYWLDHKILPLFVPGSPADNPIPYGTGLRKPIPCEAREKFDINSYDSIR